MGVCLLSSINLTLWPTRPSAHPLLLVFPLVLPSTLVAWQCFHSLRSGRLGLQCAAADPTLLLLGRHIVYLHTHTHPMHQPSLACSRWSKPIFLPVDQHLPLILQTTDNQILHRQYDVISSMVWASAPWPFQSRWCELSCYPKTNFPLPADVTIHAVTLIKYADVYDSMKTVTSHPLM